MLLKTTIPENLTAEKLQEWLTWHSQLQERYKKLKNYYDGNHSIAGRQVKVKNNANNKTISNFCQYITETLTGYFISKAIEYRADEKADMVIKKVNRLNVADDEDSELSKMASIYGHAFEVVYYDNEAEIKFMKSEPMNTFMIYDINSIDDTPAAAIRYIQSKDEVTGKSVIMVQYYDRSNVTNYKLDTNYKLISFDPPVIHGFTSLPVIEFINNEERKGDFEGIISLQDAYNVVMSDRTNNVENVVNSLLLLINYNLDSSDETKQLVQTLKENGVLAIDDQGDAKYISNPLNGATVENLRKDIREDILMLSCCPNMADEKFSGNASGVAMKYKLWNTEQKTGIKEKKFKKAIYNRLKLIGESPKPRYSFDYLEVDLVFTRNIPVNTVEILENAKNLVGTISDRAYIEYIGPHIGIEDIEAELKQKEDDAKKGLDNLGFEE